MQSENFGATLATIKDKIDHIDRAGQYNQTQQYDGRQLVSDLTYLCTYPQASSEERMKLKTREEAKECLKIMSECSCVERQVTCLISSDGYDEFIKVVRNASWADFCDLETCICSNHVNHHERLNKVLHPGSTLFDEDWNKLNIDEFWPDG